MRLNSENLGLIIAILSAFVAIVTLIAIIRIGKLQLKQNNLIDQRDEKRRDEVIYAEATQFIIKYSSFAYEKEIYLLPLCVIAYKYNPIYPYKRNIYRDFCTLTEEVQNCILKRMNIDLASEKCSWFYNKMLDYLKYLINSNYSEDRNWLYDDGKYFERALMHHGNSSIPDIRCDKDEYQKEADKNPLISAFIEEDDMEYEEHITNLLAHEIGKDPITRLMNEKTTLGTPVGSEYEILISYLWCVIGKYVPLYVYREIERENIGFVEDYQGDKCMEDLFLDTLYNIYLRYSEKERLENCNEN